MISMLDFAGTDIVFVYAHSMSVEFNVQNALLQLRRAKDFQDAKSKRSNYTICTEDQNNFLDLR